MEVDVREKLAEVAHSIWVKGVNDLTEMGHADSSGYYDISGYAIEQIAVRSGLPYEHLSEVEKDLNRVEADKMLEAISKCGAGGAGRVSDGYHTFNELYLYRKLYNAALFNEWAKSGLYEVHKSLRHSDGELCFGGGWFVVSATLPTGQVSNHYKDSDFHLFSVPERERAMEWDGHTPAIAADRIHSFLLQQLTK